MNTAAKGRFDPERDLQPVEGEPRRTDWSADVVLSVRARTAEEAAEIVARILEDANAEMRVSTSAKHLGAIFQLADAYALPEPS